MPEMTMMTTVLLVIVYEYDVLRHFVQCGVPAVDHSELVQLAEKHFSSTSLNYEGTIPSNTPCRFTGSEVSLSSLSFLVGKLV